MFGKKEVSKKPVCQKEFDKMSNEEKAKFEMEQARKELSKVKEELDNNPEAQEFLKAMGTLFGGIGESIRKAAQDQANKEDDSSSSPYYKMGNMGDVGSYSSVNVASLKQDENSYGNVRNKLNSQDYEKIYMPHYEEQDYEFDFDPKIISFLFSLDGAPYKRKGNLLVADYSTNPTDFKQWTFSKNPFLENELLEEYFYRTMKINKEKDDKRVYWVKEEVYEEDEE